MKWFSKTKYEPKVGDKPAVWDNVSHGIEATRIQKKPWTAILRGAMEIEEISEYSMKFRGHVRCERDDYFLENLNHSSQEVTEGSK